MDANETYQLVQNHYGAYAKRYDMEPNLEHSQKVAQAFGYTLDELASIPEGANLGVSCGNPLATAKLKKGDVVVDLGSGAGFDVFLAANKVGPDGKAIGVDMSEDMLELARKNMENSSASNVLFVKASITSIPLPSATADCIISNCVINLVPNADKPMVFHEMFRLLKPGGRVAISDIVAKNELPANIKRDMALYVGCIAGASTIKDYERWLKEAGFEGTLIIDKNSDLNIYKEGNLTDKSVQQTSTDGGCCSTSCCSSHAAELQRVTTIPTDHEGNTSEKSVQQKSAGGECCSTSCCGSQSLEAQKVTGLSADYDVNKWVASVQIYALKPSH